MDVLLRTELCGSSSGLQENCITGDASRLHSPHLRNRRLTKIRDYALQFKSIDACCFVKAHASPLEKAGADFGTNVYLKPENLRSLCTRVMLSEYADELGKLDEGPHSAWSLHERGLPAPCNAYLSLLQECTRKRDLAGGRHVYSQMQILELDSVAILEDHLIRLFGYCGSLEEADYAFNNVANPTVYTWHAIISAHTMHGHNHKALELYDRMLQDNTVPDKYIYPCILKACCSLGAVKQGVLIHAQIVKSGLESDVFVGSALMDMYSKCDVLEAVCSVFLRLPNRNAVSWNVIITMFVQKGEGLIALELYERMQTEGITPNIATFSSILKACSCAGALQKGKAIHGQLIARGLVSDVFIGSTLIDMYASCGMMEEALKEFNKVPKRNEVSWCTIITASAQQGLGPLAMELCEKMRLECTETDDVTFLCVLKACAIVGDIGQGMAFHDQVVKHGLDLNMVIGNSLVSMYFKCGNMNEACIVFDQLPARNVVSWAAVISGYALNGNGIFALRLFEKMKTEHVKADSITLMGVLDACASIGALGQGRLIHQQLIESGLSSDVGLGSTLINMYSKCGSLEQAFIVFSSLPEQNLRLWGMLIAGYARNGNCLLALNCLESMQGQGLKPDAMICTSILAACRHAGQVKEGYQQFKTMRDQHSIIPSIEHYGCMIDLLGRAGHLDEAEEILDSMPIRPDLTGWMSLLIASRRYGNMNLGKWCFNQVMRLDSHISAGYVAMSKIYEEAQMLDDAYKLQRERKHACAWKKPGRAWIEVNKEVHEFSVGDESHPQMDKIRIKLQSMKCSMGNNDHKPQLLSASDSMLSKNKQDFLSGHCERLAIAFGLLNAPQGTPIRVTKNLKVCRDCHSASKIMSKIEARPIIISDTYRVHEFKNGECSCGDWF
eukprot:c24791_g1_i3 orf=226-2916(+)